MDEPERISLLGTDCPGSLRVRTVILQPGDTLDFVEADWASALVVVERGALEVECRSGSRARFDEGSVLSFCGLTLRRLHTAGDVPVVLSALSRRVT